MNSAMMELMDGLTAALEIIFGCTNLAVDALIQAPRL